MVGPPEICHKKTENFSLGLARNEKILGRINNVHFLITWKSTKELINQSILCKIFRSQAFCNLALLNELGVPRLQEIWLNQ